MQPLPYHRVIGQARTQLLATLRAHLDPLATGEVSAADAEVALTMLNPRCAPRGCIQLPCAVAARAFHTQQQRAAPLECPSWQVVGCKWLHAGTACELHHWERPSWHGPG
eukprot:366479-Chlamydomonas_euryale.AAC.4